MIVYYSRSSDEAYETYWRMVFLSIIDHIPDSNLPMPTFDEESKLWVTTIPTWKNYRTWSHDTIKQNPTVVAIHGDATGMRRAKRPHRG